MKEYASLTVVFAILAAAVGALSDTHALTAAQSTPQAVGGDSSQPRWAKSIAENPESLALLTSGAVIVSSKAGLTAIQPSTGMDLWSRPEVTGYSALDDAFALVRNRDGSSAVIDLETGREKWNLNVLKLKKQRGVLLVGSPRVLLAWGEGQETPHSVVAAKFESGEVLWRQDSLFSTPELAPQGPKAGYDKIALEGKSAVFSPSKGGLFALDWGSGKVLWRATDKNLIGGGIATGPVVIAGGRVFLAHDTTVFAVDASDGRLVWKLVSKLPRPVVQMVSTSKGLLVRGSFDLKGSAIHPQRWQPYLALLDFATGKVTWSTLSRKAFNGRSEFLLEGDRLLIASKTGLSSFDLATGEAQVEPQLAESAADPCCLERLPDDRLLVSSAETLRLLDRDGRIVYDKYFKAPGASGLAKFGAIAAIAAQGAAAGASPMGGFVDVGVAGVFAVKHGSRTSDSRFAYLFTEAPDPSGRMGFSLVRVVKETGEEAGRVWLTSRDPTYALDPVTGVVVIAKEKGLFAQAFPETR